MTDNPYTRCPDCTMIAPPSGMDYALAAGGGIDWDQPVRVTCVICHADHQPQRRDVLPPDTEMTCKRCGARAAYPAGAARVLCTSSTEPGELDDPDGLFSAIEDVMAATVGGGSQLPGLVYDAVEDLAGEFTRYRAAHLILAAADRRYRLGLLIAAGRKAVGAARLPWDGDDLASVRALATVWDNLAAALPDQEAP